MLAVTGLIKRYGPTTALDHLTLSIPGGTVFGLLGPNASGKSTLLKLLMGFIFPDQGQIDLGGLAPAAIGYVPERPHLPPGSRIGEYLHTAGRLAGLGGAQLQQEVARCLQTVGLEHVAGWRIRACSKGMLQRLALAQALLADPPVLVLDEPMGGLDPAGQKAIRELIKSLPAAGKTVLFSTHRLSEVTEVCSHLAILNRGRLIRTGPLAEVLPLRPQVTICVDHLPAEMGRLVAALDSDISITGNSILLEGEAVRRKAEVVRHLLDAGMDIASLNQQRATVEDVYLEAIRC